MSNMTIEVRCKLCGFVSEWKLPTEEVVVCLQCGSPEVEELSRREERP